MVSAALRVYERENVTIVSSSEERDNFIKNLATVLAEARLLLTIPLPAGVLKYETATV